LATTATLIGAQFYTSTIHAAPLSDEDAQALIRRVNELEQQVKVLERDREVDQETATTKAKETPTVSLGAYGLMVRSGDSNFTMNAYGYAQADYRAYLGQKTVPDTFLLRRVRPIIEGTVWQDINYRLMLDLGSGNVASSTANNNNILDDAYVNARFWNQLQIQVGKYKSPIGLERLQSTADLFFVETGFATELTPNYDLGAEIHNDYFNTPVGYALGIFDGAADNASQDADVDQGKDVVGRLFTQPFLNKQGSPLQHLGFGVAGSEGTHTAGPLTTYKTPGQQTFFTYANVAPNGIQYRIDPQAYYFWGPFGVIGEWVLSSQKFTSTKAGLPPVERFNNTAWQVEASWFVTGEENSFKYISRQHVTPRHNFGISEGSGWGALELVARVQQLALDQNSLEKHGGNAFVTPGSAQKATAWGVGVNWYLNPNLKLNLDYENTTFTGYTPTATAASFRPEHVILSRVQFSF
ncbi:MAG: Phosphate-selective porin, partial [Pedosphaera sp.]|nr:Phosphate-selective porin [Pedosphaera sp.]